MVRAVEVTVPLSPKKGYRSPELLERMRTLLVERSFKEKPKGSNSMVQLLSQTNLQTLHRFWIIEGETRTLFRTKGREVRWAVPVATTGRREPLPTTIW
jgi:hypothetical protein